ncbi:MAG TPA: hypothetical protein DCO86_00580 [Spirochaetaceae bacterium]|nr:hypothetical protein [Spirochaetaceae bacterium]
MFSFVWPVALIVVSNVFYQVCAKSAPEGMDSFAMLVITYVSGAVLSIAMYFILNKGGDLLAEFKKTNITPFAWGLVLIGLEVGSIYAYKAGWKISVMQIVQVSFLAVALIFVGYFAYKEKITWNKIAGMVVCLIGLGLVNWK